MTQPERLAHPVPVRSGPLRHRRSGPGYQAHHFPMARRAYADGLGQAQRQHTIHGLIEVDVTQARRLVRRGRDNRGDPLSFTAWIAACVACAVQAHPMVQAHRWGASTVVLFDDVDVSVQLDQVLVDGSHIVRSRVLRAANRRTVADLSEEVHDARAGGRVDAQRHRATVAFARLPRPARTAVMRTVLARPFLSKKLTGTVMVTSVGMFGAGLGWGIPISPAPLSVTVGGIGERPVLVDGRLENREHLSLTVSVDHDLVDGALAARFTQALRELIESGHGLGTEADAHPTRFAG